MSPNPSVAIIKQIKRTMLQRFRIFLLYFVWFKKCAHFQALYFDKKLWQLADTFALWSGRNFHWWLILIPFTKFSPEHIWTLTWAHSQLRQTHKTSCLACIGNKPCIYKRLALMEQTTFHRTKEVQNSVVNFFLQVQATDCCHSQMENLHQIFVQKVYTNCK